MSAGGLPEKEVVVVKGVRGVRGVLDPVEVVVEEGLVSGEQ